MGVVMHISELNTKDFVINCRAIESPEELAECALLEARKLGFEYISASGGALRYPKPEQVLYPGFPPEWTSYYLQHALYEHDPVLRRVTETELPFEWSDLEMPEPEAAAIFAQAQDLGLKKGYVVPLQGLNSYTGYVSFGGADAELTPQGRLDLQLIGIYFHHRLREMRDASDEASYWGNDLTGRERECLNWIAAGKSNWEVGEILNISENTVKTHADKIMSKFGVTTRVQAVVEGIRRGLIGL